MNVLKYLYHDSNTISGERSWNFHMFVVLEDHLILSPLPSNLHYGSMQDQAAQFLSRKMLDFVTL